MEQGSVAVQRTSSTYCTKRTIYSHTWTTLRVHTYPTCLCLPSSDTGDQRRKVKGGAKRLKLATYDPGSQKVTKESDVIVNCRLQAILEMMRATESRAESRKVS